MEDESTWAIEFYNLYQNKNINEIRKRLIEISNVFIYLHEILAEKNVLFPEKDIYSEQLIIKFHLQNLSLLELSKGQSIESNYFSFSNSEINFLDISSIFTIVRSQYESLLMYQHIYINASNENDQKLRFEAWIMSSMLSRSKIFIEAQNKFPEKIIKERISIKELKESIKNNPEFHKLSEKQRVKLLKIGSGKLFKTWDTIFKESKFDENGIFSKIYYIASAYAHSEGLLALQLKETKSLMENPNMKTSNFLMLFYSYLMTNIMIKNIIRKYPIVKERFDNLDEKIKFEVNFNYKLAFK